MVINQSDEELVLFFSEDHMTFLTNKVDADYHQHHYIQMTFALERNFDIFTDKEVYHTKWCVIDSNISHILQGKNQWQLYLLINPESVFGKVVKQKFLYDNEISIFKEKEIAEELLQFIHSLKFIDNSEDYYKYLKKLKKGLNLIDERTVHIQIDSRIKDILNYIDTSPLDQLSLTYLSNKIYLSESRLSHLFKEEIGFSLTSYILQKKLKKAFQLILDGEKITDAAIESGFNSSSHFSRTVREKLGMPPRLILKNSRYLQV